MKPEASVVHGLKAEPKEIPSVDRLLASVPALVEAHGHRFVAGEARALLDGLRVQALSAGLEGSALDPAALVTALEARSAQRLAPRIRRVLNLTGTVIHTNL